MNGRGYSDTWTSPGARRETRLRLPRVFCATFLFFSFSSWCKPPPLDTDGLRCPRCSTLALCSAHHVPFHRTSLASLHPRPQHYLDATSPIPTCHSRCQSCSTLPRAQNPHLPLCKNPLTTQMVKSRQQGRTFRLRTFPDNLGVYARTMADCLR